MKAREVYNVTKQTNKQNLKLKLANTCLPSFIIGHHMGKSDHYAVTIHLGVFLLFRDIISSKTSSKNITTTRCTHWYKSIKKRYGLNCDTHSMIKYPHLRELFSKTSFPVKVLKSNESRIDFFTSLNSFSHYLLTFSLACVIL